MGKKGKRVIITMTMEDWQAIKAAADRDGRSVASFLRQKALEAVEESRKK